jgi:hypothetical protein
MKFYFNGIWHLLVLCVQFILETERERKKYANISQEALSTINSQKQITLNLNEKLKKIYVHSKYVKFQNLGPPLDPFSKEKKIVNQGVYVFFRLFLPVAERKVSMNYK